MRENERIESQYNSKLKFLERETAYLIDDEAVRLYLFLQKEIKATQKDKQKALATTLKQYQNECNHPIFVCLNKDNIDNEYTCICLNCGKCIEMSFEEVDYLYNAHRMIATPKTNIDINDGSTYPYYIFLYTSSENTRLVNQHRMSKPTLWNIP